MSINENITSAEEALSIFQSLALAKPEDEKESIANANTFNDTLLTVFYHDQLTEHESTPQKWLTADCAQAIYEIAQHAPDDRLRLVTAAHLSYVAMREQHQAAALNIMTEILKNPHETDDVRWQAMSAMDELSYYHPQVSDHVSNVFATIISNKDNSEMLRTQTAVHILMSRRQKLERFLSEDSVDSLIRTLNEDGDLRVRHYAGAVLSYALNESDTYRGKIEPQTALIESISAEFWRQEKGKEAEPSAGPS